MTEKAKRLQLLQHQLARLERRLNSLRQRSEQFSRWRLILFALGALVSGGSFFQWGPVVWLWVTAVAFIPFIVAVVVHQRVDTAVTRFAIWQQMKQTHIARMTLDWARLPAPKSFSVESDHPFAFDIDLVGEFSLHRLLDTAVSREGSHRLHHWLLAQSPQAADVLTRQARVRELAGQTRFRERLALQATLAVDNRSEQWAGQELVDWLQAENEGRSLRPLLIGLSGLAVLNWLLFAGYQLWNWPPLWIGTILLYGALFIILGFQRTATLFSDIMFLSDRLQLLNGVFAFLEQWRFRQMPQVQQLCQPFLVAGERPSAHIGRIQRVMTGVGLRQNWLLGFVLNALMPWDIYFAYRLDQCRADLARQLPHWLDIWYELEALNSLATFAYLNPGEWTWPTLADSPMSLLKNANAEAQRRRDGKEENLRVQWHKAAKSADFIGRLPMIAATRLGHPLIPSEQRVCNDLHLDAEQAIYLITGSNMAGKSSFLRTIGVNLVLAYAGGPVVGQTFRASWLRLFATIRVADSLTDGFSFFYAEVRRLSQLLTALEDEGERPLLFLIDEIFRGTNNRERLIGSRAYIQALTQGTGLGAIATHDLELVQLAEETPRLVNVHFRDDVVDGRMVFDYKLHPGPCPTTNALKIMELAGLPIEPQT